MESSFISVGFTKVVLLIVVWVVVLKNCLNWFLLL